MQKVNVSPEQVRTAAAAGLTLLADQDLKVPVQVALTGQLGILQSMLSALANGEVVLANPQPAEVKEPGVIGSDIPGAAGMAVVGEGAN